MPALSRRSLLRAAAAAALLPDRAALGAVLAPDHTPNGQPAPAPPRLIVRADDMGYAQAGNEAIRRCVVGGVATAVEVLAPSPWFPEAARVLRALPTADPGVHLALTSEWDNVKWRPLTPAPSLRDADGYFFPMAFPNARYPGRAVAQQAWRLEDVEAEFRAQIALAKRHLPRLSHWSAHMGCTDLRPDVAALAQRLGREYGIDRRPEAFGVEYVGYAGPHATSAEKVASFLATLDRLDAGRTYLFVDHPGLDTPELRAVGHLGYEHVAADRQGVTDAWTHPRVRARVRERGIRLIGYRDLGPSGGGAGGR